MRDTILKFRVLRDMVMSAYTEWLSEVWDRDLDARWCCNGRECGCGGVSVREVWCYEARANKGNDHG